MTEAAEIIRVSLRNLNLLGMEDASAALGGSDQTGMGIRGDSLYSATRGLSVEDRREFIQNMLLSSVSAGDGRSALSAPTHSHRR